MPFLTCGQGKGLVIIAHTATPEIVLVGFVSRNFLIFGMPLTSALSIISMSVGIFFRWCFLHSLIFSIASCFFEGFFFFISSVISLKKFCFMEDRETAWYLKVGCSSLLR